MFLRVLTCDLGISEVPWDHFSRMDHDWGERGDKPRSYHRTGRALVWGNSRCTVKVYVLSSRHLSFLYILLKSSQHIARKIWHAKRSENPDFFCLKDKLFRSIPDIWSRNPYLTMFVGVWWRHAWTDFVENTMYVYATRSPWIECIALVCGLPAKGPFYENLGQVIYDAIFEHSTLK